MCVHACLCVPQCVFVCICMWCIWIHIILLFYPVCICAAGLCIRWHRFVCTGVYLYIYNYVCQQKNRLFITLPLKNLQLSVSAFSLSKMPLVWFAKSSELYRQSNSYFSIRAMWVPGPWNIVYGTQVRACCSAENYFSFSFCCSFYCITCHYGSELSLQLSPLTVLSAPRVCVLWNSSLCTFLSTLYVGIFYTRRA